MSARVAESCFARVSFEALAGPLLFKCDHEMGEDGGRRVQSSPFARNLGGMRTRAGVEREACNSSNATICLNSAHEFSRRFEVKRSLPSVYRQIAMVGAFGFVLAIAHLLQPDPVQTASARSVTGDASFSYHVLTLEAGVPVRRELPERPKVPEPAPASRPLVELDLLWFAPGPARLLADEGHAFVASVTELFRAPTIRLNPTVTAPRLVASRAGRNARGA